MRFRQRKWKIGRLVLFIVGIAIVTVIALVVKENLKQRESFLYNLNRSRY